MNAKVKGPAVLTDIPDKSEILSPAPSNDDDLIYNSDIPIDTSLQSFAEILHISQFSILGRVKRYDQDTKSFDSCFEFMPAEVPIEERIRRDYGPGAYEVWVYSKGKIYKRLKLTIERPIVASLPTQDRPVGAPGGSVAYSSSVHDGQGGISNDKSLEDQVEALKREVSQLKDTGHQDKRRGQHQQGSMVQQMGEMLGLVKQFKGFDDKGKEEPINPLNAATEGMKMVASIADQMGYVRPDGGSVDAEPESSIFTQDFLKEMAGAISGAALEARPLIDAYKLNAITKHNESLMAHGYPPNAYAAADGNQQKTSAPPDGYQPKHGGAPAAGRRDTSSTVPAAKPAPAAKPDTAVEVPNMNEPTLLSQDERDDVQRLQVHMEFLKVRAEYGSAPVTYAEVTADIFEPEFLRGSVLRPGALDYVAAKDPGVAKYKSWFAELLTILEGIVESIETEYREEDEILQEEKAGAKNPEGGVNESRTDASQIDKSTHSEPENAGNNQDEEEKGTIGQAAKEENT